MHRWFAASACGSGISRPLVEENAARIDDTQHLHGTWLDAIDQQERMPTQGAFAGIPDPGSELEAQACNPLCLLDDLLDCLISNPLIGSLQVPCPDAIEILLETRGKPKRLCCESGHGRRA